MDRPASPAVCFRIFLSDFVTNVGHQRENTTGSFYTQKICKLYTSREGAVRTNIEIDDKLMKKALRATGTKTKKAAVETALRIAVTLHQQEKVRELRGIAHWEGDLEQLRMGRFTDREW